MKITITTIPLYQFNLFKTFTVNTTKFKKRKKETINTRSVLKENVPENNYVIWFSILRTSIEIEQEFPAVGEIIRLNSPFIYTIWEENCLKIGLPIKAQE